ncbi:putative siderophore iron transporter [Xylogone sp. PMI_703]|nr:putative siderophore iron transporter [Xylogone sp. PMI_703]
MAKSPCRTLDCSLRNSLEAITEFRFTLEAERNNMSTLAADADSKSIQQSRPRDDVKPVDGSSSATHPIDMDATTGDAGQVTGLATLTAMESTWSVRSLIVAWVSAFLMSCAVSFDTQTVYSFQPYATSSFGAAPLLGTIQTVQSVISSVMQQPLARLADVYGRFELFAACVLIVTVGEILLASSKTLSTYAGAQVFFIVGTLGLQLMLQLLAGDSSDLRNRAIMNTVPFLPGIITCWTASYVTSAVLADASWRWGYGIFAILFPAVSIPLLSTLFYNQRKALRAKGAVAPKNHFLVFRQLDPIGSILFGAGLTLILIPITLAVSSTNTWKSAHIIAMIVVGAVCLVAFVAWEILGAKWPIVSINLMNNGTVMFGIATSLMDYAALNSYSGYFFSYLVVACGQSVKASTNVTIVLSFTAVFGQLGAAILVKYIGWYKWITASGIALKVLGIGLMFRYRDAHDNLGRLVVAQVIIGAGDGIMNTVQVGMQAAISQSAMASVTALLITGCGVGAAIGGAIAGGIWTNLLPQRLRINLPASAQGQWADIESSIVVALNYAWGTPERDAINKSYDDVMRILLTVSVALESVSLLCSLMLKDFSLKTVDETREYGGMVIGKTGIANNLKRRLCKDATAENSCKGDAEELPI